MGEFKPRLIASAAAVDPDGVKLYTVSAHWRAVDEAPFLAELEHLKKSNALNWQTTPAFAIFTDGQTAEYLVLAWWGNDNELFTRVAVREAGPARRRGCQRWRIGPAGHRSSWPSP